MEKGQTYNTLKPVVTIWLLGRTMLRQSEHWHHAFRAHDPDRNVVLCEHFAIHTLELTKWRRPEQGPLDGVDRWMYFFKEGKGWDSLPPDLNDPMMRQAMDVLERFSEKEDDYMLYRARQDFLRIKLSDEELLNDTVAALEQAQAAKEEERAAKEQAQQRVEQERAAKEQERAAKEQERAARARAEAELARLRERMRDQGIDPEA